MVRKDVPPTYSPDEDRRNADWPKRQGYLDDDENVKAMRATAREVGLTGLLVKAHASEDPAATKDLLLIGLRLLGESR